MMTRRCRSTTSVSSTPSPSPRKKLVFQPSPSSSTVYSYALPRASSAETTSRLRPELPSMMSSMKLKMTSTSSTSTPSKPTVMASSIAFKPSFKESMTQGQDQRKQYQIQTRLLLKKQQSQSMLMPSPDPPESTLLVSSSTAPMSTQSASNKQPSLTKQQSQSRITETNVGVVLRMTPIRSATKDRRLNQYLAKATCGKAKNKMTITSSSKVKGRMYVDTTFSSLAIDSSSSPIYSVPKTIAVIAHEVSPQKRLSSPQEVTASNCRLETPSTVASISIGDRFIANRSLSARRLLFNNNNKDGGDDDDGGGSQTDNSRHLRNAYNRHLLGAMCNSCNDESTDGGDGAVLVYRSAITDQLSRNGSSGNNDHTTDAFTNGPQSNTLRAIPALAEPYATRNGGSNLDGLATGGRGLASSSSFSTLSSMYRHVPRQPAKTLDAPDLANDFYLQCLDWSSNNIVAIALHKTIYLWNAVTGATDEMGPFRDTDDRYGGEIVTSLAWSKVSCKDTLAVGYGTSIAVFDTSRCDQIRSLRVLQGHPSHRGRNYLTAMDWKDSNCVTSSTKHDTQIFHQDLRCRRPTVMVFQGHRVDSGGVCGLKWSHDGKVLAAGGNDDTICLFDIAMSGRQRSSSQSSPEAFSYSRVQPRSQLEGHKGAIKGMDWCPSSPHLLASGGGALDLSLRLWNTTSGECCSTFPTDSQVTGVKWSLCGRSLCSSHGWHSRCPLILWDHKSSPHSLTQIQGVGHSLYRSQQAFYLSMCPDGKHVAVAGDEALCFYDIFRPSVRKQVRSDPALDPMGKSTFGMRPIR